MPFTLSAEMPVDLSFQVKVGTLEDFECHKLELAIRFR
jgi:hypothetical protein